MVRNGQAWELGEPDLNDRGLPVVHNIADKLGCIRPNGDIDLPVHSVFPEDEAGMAELAVQLEDQQTVETMRGKDDSEAAHHDHGSSSDGDHSDLELDYRKLAFGRHNTQSSGATHSPQSYAGSHDFDFGSTSTDFDQGMFASPSSSSLPNFATTDDWTLSKASVESGNLAMQFLQQTGGFQNIDLLGQGAGLIEPLAMNNADMMMGINDPMIYSNFEAEMR